MPDLAPSYNVAHSVYRWLPLTEIWLSHQIRYLPTDQVCAHVICEQTANLDRFAHQPLHVLAQRGIPFTVQRTLRRLGIRYHLPVLANALRENQISLVHSHFGDKAWLDHESIRQANARQVVTFYGQDVNRLPQQAPIWRERYHSLFAFASRILCEGSAMGKSLIKLGAPADKVQVQHLGVEVDKIDFKPRHKRPDEPFKVLLACTFTDKKGLPYGLEALGKLKKEHNVDLEITMIGDANPSSEKQQKEKTRILKVIQDWGLQNCTRLLGYQPYQTMLDEAFKNHIFMSPSVTASDGDTEGGAPVSLIDMQATGMPIVSSLHCDIPEVVSDGKSGLLAPEKDVDMLTKHLHWFATHPERWVDFGTAGRKHIETEYNAVIQGQRLAKIYREVMAE
ncbi:MAG: glycosyltransferase [Anaerolineae bacterium]